MLGPEGPSKLALTILTFGFKNGPPRDADLMFDVRFLPNPHYREDLRPLTGRDPKVVEHVEAGDLAGEFYQRLLPLLDFLLPAYVAEGKSHLTIAIGCTGGRHRSVDDRRPGRPAPVRARGPGPARRPPRRRARLSVPDRARSRRRRSVIIPRCERPGDQRPRPAQVLRRRRGGPRDRPRGFAAARSSPSSARTARARRPRSRSSRATASAPAGEVDGARRRTRRMPTGDWRQRIGIVLQQCGCSPSSRCARRSSCTPATTRGRAGRRRDDRARRARARRPTTRVMQPLRRPAAPPRRRPGADRRPGAALPRRADDRLRPLGPAPGLGR